MARHLLLPVVLTVWVHSLHAQPAESPRPNFVLIVADDLGYGDLGCYGSRIHRTPHLDRLAAEGIRFTDFHSNGSMCTPTRAALLTGLYQQRFGRQFEGPLSGRTQRDQGLPLAAVTIAEVLQRHGYATGMYGKWHLGYRPPLLPTRQGFGDFRGLVSGDGDHHTHIDRSGNQDWWHNEQLVMEQGYTAELLTRHSIAFIERHRGEPFFLYLPHLAIHFPWQGPSDPPHREQGTDYWNDKWGIIPDRTNVRPHVKAMVESLDRSVGNIVAALKRLRLARRTLVLFVSDNGGYLHYGETHMQISSNGPLRGQKGELLEGGHRVPAIAWWPGRIGPRVCGETTMTFDLFPTLLRLAKLEPPAAGQLDGRDLTPLLFPARARAPWPRRTLFWRDGEEYAARDGPWKLVGREGGNPQLFHLAEDLGETRDLAAERPGVVARLSKAYQAWATEVSTESL